MGTTMLDIYNHLLPIFSSDRFLKKQGLGNELPFFIYPYQINQQINILENLQKIKEELIARQITTLEINLYDIAIEIIQQRGIWQDILEQELNISKEEFKETLQGILDTETYLVPAIKNKIDALEYQILFITGVGEIFPYIRSHNVLNNLQTVAKDYPTVMFFPGEYTQINKNGSSLELFGKLHDDNYYRAFNIHHYEI